MLSTIRHCHKIGQASILCINHLTKSVPCVTKVCLQPTIRTFHKSVTLYKFDDDMFGDKFLKRPDWNDQELETFTRNIFSPGPTYASKSEEEIQKYLETNRISIVRSTSEVPKPVFSFEECGFSPQVLQKMGQLGFTKPMPIQAQGWPIAMTGLDMIGIGETGSGKTLGFLLPAFEHIKSEAMKGEGPRVLILSPTRELAQQTEEVARR